MDNLEELFAEASKLDIPFEENIQYETIEMITEHIKDLELLKKLLVRYTNTPDVAEEIMRNGFPVEFEIILRNLKPQTYQITENCRKMAMKLGISLENIDF